MGGSNVSIKHRYLLFQDIKIMIKLLLHMCQPRCEIDVMLTDFTEVW